MIEELRAQIDAVREKLALAGLALTDAFDKINKSRDNIIERINSGPPIPQPGRNTPVNPYKPPFLTSCCFNDQNEIAPLYNLRP